MELWKGDYSVPLLVLEGHVPTYGLWHIRSQLQHLLLGVGRGGLLAADRCHGQQLLCRSAVEIGVPNRIALARHQVSHGDEVSEDEAQHDVFAVKVDERLEER